MNEQPDAQRLAELLEARPRRSGDAAIAAELRRLQAENEQFRAMQMRDLERRFTDQALLLQALEFIDQHCAVKHPSQIAPRDDLADAIRQHLENKQ